MSINLENYLEVLKMFNISFKGNEYSNAYYWYGKIIMLHGDKVIVFGKIPSKLAYAIDEKYPNVGIEYEGKELGKSLEEVLSYDTDLTGTNSSEKEVEIYKIYTLEGLVCYLTEINNYYGIEPINLEEKLSKLEGLNSGLKMN